MACVVLARVRVPGDIAGQVGGRGKKEEATTAHKLNGDSAQASHATPQCKADAGGLHGWGYTSMETAVAYGRVCSDEDVYRARIGGVLRDAAPRYRLIDLFAGAGGLTLGFTTSLGHFFEPVWANDFNAYVAATCNRTGGRQST